MNEILIYTVLVLCSLGVLSAVILYFVAQKFKVYEDPRIDEVEKMLPGANCGGCGYPGCRGLADALVKNDDILALNCPAGGAQVMERIAEYLGKAAGSADQKIAVVRCGGSCEKREKMTVFDGAKSCAVVASVYGGETGCSYGCLGKGDCAVVCAFGAITMDAETGLPIIDQDKCTSCGACVKACPKAIIELRNKGIKDRRIYVNCSSKDRGDVALNACFAACTACGACEKECKFGAITIENNLAYIDAKKCKLCRKCAPVCQYGAIVEINFPAKKQIAEQMANNE